LVCCTTKTLATLDRRGQFSEEYLHA
jgi:hypothetical protein